MNRKGRQNGTVKTHALLPNPLHPRPESRHVDKLNALATAGSFTRVPVKHSKITGKCGLAGCNACHLNPAHEANPKTKARQKTIDVADNHRLTWQSASGILVQLAVEYDDIYW